MQHKCTYRVMKIPIVLLDFIVKFSYLHFKENYSIAHSMKYWVHQYNMLMNLKVLGQGSGYCKYVRKLNKLSTILTGMICHNMWKRIWTVFHTPFYDRSSQTWNVIISSIDSKILLSFSRAYGITCNYVWLLFRRCIAVIFYQNGCVFLNNPKYFVAAKQN